jgi:hypothetical protein
MRTLKLETVLDLLAQKYPNFTSPKVSQVQEVDFYSEIYNLTYNHASIDMPWYKFWIDKLELPKGSTFLETFSGAGTDSVLLQKEYPDFKFALCDIASDYAEIEGNLPTLVEDVLDAPFPIRKDLQFDVVFMADNNKSLVEVRTVDELMAYAKYCAARSKKYAVISYMELREVDTFYVEVEEYKLEYPCAKSEIGKYAEWGTILMFDEDKGCHLHHDILSVFSLENHKGEVAEKVLYSSGYTAKAWPLSSVISAMQYEGFKLKEKILDNYLLFEKFA